MTKRNFVMVVTILAFFSVDSTVHADRLFQGRIINRLFGGGERNAPPKKKEAKEKKAKKNKKQPSESAAEARADATLRSFKSNGFGLQIRTKNKRLTVVRVVENGMAKQAGIQVGDQIVKLAGANVENVEIFREIEKVLEPGNEVEVVLRRSGKRKTLTIAFAKPAPSQGIESDPSITPPADPAPPQEPTPAIAPSDEQQTSEDKSILRFPEELIP